VPDNYKDGSEVLIKQKNKAPRRLTPRECARLQGYPEHFIVDAVSMTNHINNWEFGDSAID
jgi:DNA (cytosine-5)-methyltransferase 1